MFELKSMTHLWLATSWRRLKLQEALAHLLRYFHDGRHVACMTKACHVDPLEINTID